MSRSTPTQVRWLAIVAVGIVVCLAASACRVVPDPLEDLGSLGGEYTTAHAVNGRGVIVGSTTPPGPPGSSAPGEAFFLEPDDGTMTSLGVLVAGQRSIAVDINDHDVAVGSAWIWGQAAVSELEHAVVFDPGTGIIDLHGLLGSWDESGTVAINDDGVVVGWALRYFSVHLPVVAETISFAFDLGTSALTVLPIEARDINDLGLVVGSADGRAASYDLATASRADLGTLGGSTSSAEAVNRRGDVAGTSETAAGEWHAFRRDAASGTMTDLGTLGGAGSTATGINDQGDVVGESVTGSGAQHPFFSWSANRSMTDLGTLGGVNFLGATDINNSLVVVGFTREGASRGWRTTVRLLPHD